MRNWLARRIYGYLKEENGATAVEFAIVSTIFLTLVFGIFETALILFTWNSLQDSLEKATRYALVHPDATSDELKQIVADSMNVHVRLPRSPPNLACSSVPGSKKSVCCLNCWPIS